MEIPQNKSGNEEKGRQTKGNGGRRGAAAAAAGECPVSLTSSCGIASAASSYPQA